MKPASAFELAFVIPVPAAALKPNLNCVAGDAVVVEVVPVAPGFLV